MLLKRAYEGNQLSGKLKAVVPIYVVLRIRSSNTFASVSVGVKGKIRKVFNMSNLKERTHRRSYKHTHRKLTSELVRYLVKLKPLKKKRGLGLGLISSKTRNVTGDTRLFFKVSGPSRSVQSFIRYIKLRLGYVSLRSQKRRLRRLISKGVLPKELGCKPFLRWKKDLMGLVPFLKPFNGCRPCKLRRKKRKGFRSFKPQLPKSRGVRINKFQTEERPINSLKFSRLK